MCPDVLLSPPTLQLLGPPLHPPLGKILLSPFTHGVRLTKAHFSGATARRSGSRGRKSCGASGACGDGTSGHRGKPARWATAPGAGRRRVPAAPATPREAFSGSGPGAAGPSAQRRIFCVPARGITRSPAGAAQPPPGPPGLAQPRPAPPPSVGPGLRLRRPVSRSPLRRRACGPWP